MDAMLGIRMKMKKVWNEYFALWRKLTGRKLYFFYIIHYTLLFLILIQFVFAPFFKAEKGFVWHDDGISQHFTRLVYISSIIREGLCSLISGKGWSIPMYDFRTGFIAQDLQIGFPQILAAFWPMDKIDIFYNYYVIINYYLIGLSFSAFGFFFRQKPLSIMVGAITYAFCGYAIFAGVRHPHFVVPMIFLPLLVIGTEKVLRKEKAWLLLCTVFLSLTTQWGLYFFCMQAIFIIIYTSVRFFDVYKEERLQELLKLIGRLLVWGGTGVLLGCFVAIPSLLAILGTGRVGNDVTSFKNMLHYEISYYKNFITDFTLMPDEIGEFFGSWVFLGFSTLTVPAVLLLFFDVKKKKERSLRILFILLTVMLFIPAVAYVMSGFSNISGRFCFGYAFIVAAILMFMLPRFVDIERGRMAVVGILLVVYFAIDYFVVKQSANQVKPFIMLLVAVLIYICCILAGEKGKQWIPPCCLAITCFSVWYSSYLKYNSNEGNYVGEFWDDPYMTLDGDQYSSLSQSKEIIEDKSFYRVTGDSISRQELGVSFYYNLNGLSAYPYFGWSNAYIKWLEEMEVARSTNKHVVYDLDARASLISLASIKYFAEREKELSFAPYGFTQVDNIENFEEKDVIWENEYWLPIGYTYKNYMEKKQYETLDVLGKQEAQICSVVLDEVPRLSSLINADVTMTAKKIPYEIAEMKGLTWEDEKITIEETNATLMLTFAGIPKSETYLRIINLDLTNGDSTQYWWLKAVTDNTSASAGFVADAFPYAHRQKTQILNMGYSEDGYNNITITFPSKGTYCLNNIEIWCQPMNDYFRQIDALKEDVLENIKTNWRGLTGTISLSTDKFLCLAIPYMDGWKAYVDGEEVKLYQANTAFMGVELLAGNHEVELRYWLPGLTVGIILSGIGVICLFALVIYQIKSGT